MQSLVSRENILTVLLHDAFPRSQESQQGTADRPIMLLIPRHWGQAGESADFNPRELPDAFP